MHLSLGRPGRRTGGAPIAIDRDGEARGNLRPLRSARDASPRSAGTSSHGTRMHLGRGIETISGNGDPANKDDPAIRISTRVPEPHMGRAARNCIAVSLVSRACHPVRCTRFPDWSDTDQTEGRMCMIRVAIMSIVFTAPQRVTHRRAPTRLPRRQDDSRVRARTLLSRTFPSPFATFSPSARTRDTRGRDNDRVISNRELYRCLSPPGASSPSHLRQFRTLAFNGNSIKHLLHILIFNAGYLCVTGS